MQEFRNDELLNTLIVEDPDNLPSMSEEATHRTIGKFPKRNQEVKLNGLLWEVTHSDYAQGVIYLKIKRPYVTEKED